MKFFIRYSVYLKRAILLSLMLLSGAAAAQGVLELTSGMHRVQAEVMYTEAGRERGLMYRKEMAAHQGMLFVFPMRAQHCMWMRNTDLPLAVAFMDDAGKIINIEEMEPHTETNHCAKQPARYALEMNTGWFSRRAIGPGSIIKGVEKAPAPQ